MAPIPSLPLPRGDSRRQDSLQGHKMARPLFIHSFKKLSPSSPTSRALSGAVGVFDLSLTDFGGPIFLVVGFPRGAVVKNLPAKQERQEMWI